MALQSSKKTAMRSLIVIVFALLSVAPALAQDANAANVVVSASIADLPSAVAQTRQKLLDAALSGNIEALRPIFDAQAEPPHVSFSASGDSIADLKRAAGDEEGFSTLAALANTLIASYAVLDSQSDEPLYIWPYLSAMDLNDLTPAQKVDAYRLVEAEDFANFQDSGWLSWRAVIGEDGTLYSFIAGD